MFSVTLNKCPVPGHLVDKRKKRKSKTGELFKQVCKHITAVWEIKW